MLPVRYQRPTAVTPLGRFVESFFDDFFSDDFFSPNWAVLARPTWAAMNVRDAGEAYEVELALPGLKPEQIDIQLQNGVLTVRTAEQAESERKQDGYLLREMRQGGWVRSVQLPAAIDPDRAEARYEHGVLTITVPKAESARPRKIAIKS